MSWNYLIRRFCHTIILILIVLTLNFFLPRVVPGDPAARFYEDPRLSPEARLEIKAQFGLDRSLWEQYRIYLGNTLRGDFGFSFSYRRPVLNVIMTRIPWTLLLTISSLLFSIVTGTVLGALAAWWRGGKLDTGLLMVAIIVSALPNFWIAMMLILLLAFTYPLFPAYGMVSSQVDMAFSWEFIRSVAHHAFLPVFCLSLLQMVSFGVLIRNSMLGVINADYVRTARAKGLGEGRVLFAHAFRNALLPLITRVAMSIPMVMGGAVIIETIFSWEGMGLLIVEASRALDYPLLQTTMLFLALLTIFGNFLADVLYLKADPRISYE